MKISAIGQALIQAARPRTVLTPLQLGLAVQMHHHFQSKYLIESLHALGFSASYKEVLQFERNAAMTSGAKLDGHVGESTTLKFSADNVDHNTCTLNGQNTFHGMGMVASISKGKFKTIEVPRNTVSNNELLKISQIEIINYHQRKDLLQGIMFKSLDKAAFSSSYIDLLWELSWHFKNPLPIWSGTMQLIHENQDRNHHEKDNVTFLPIIDLDPN